MATYEFMKGWDLIAGTKQKNVNALLRILPDIHVDYNTKVNVFGSEIGVNFKILVQAPTINVKDVSGREVDVIFPVSGSVTFGTQKVELPDTPKPQSLIATVQLTKIEAELQDKKDAKKTRYDVILDLLSKSLIVNLEYNGVTPFDLAVLIAGLKSVLQDYIAKHQQYKIVSFYLNNDHDNKYKSFIPHLADFTFIRDKDDVDNSDVLILMLTKSRKRGAIFFDEPILPKNVEHLVMINNHLFLEEIVYPQVIKNIKKEAKHKDNVEKYIEISPNNDTGELWTIQNTHDIDLDKDHDPWISTIQCKIDEKVDQLMIYLDVKANATFLEIHVDTWAKTWLKMENDHGKIDLKKVKDDSGHSSNLEWWKWLLSFLISWIVGIVVAIVDGVVKANIPDLAGKFGSVATTTVEWPFQKYIAIKDVETPGHIVFVVDVKF